MLKTLFLSISISGLPLAASAQSSGDAQNGADLFAGQCTACHVVATPDGNVLAGRNAKVGPNLYGVAGRSLGSVEDFRYSRALNDAGDLGLTWTEDNFVGFVQDPTGWLREELDDSRARGRMSYQVRDPGHAVDIYAYLESLQ